MRCPSCGSDNPDDYQFCSVCGTRLISPFPYSAPIKTYLDRSRKLRNRHIIIVIVGVVVFLALLIYILATVHVMSGTLVINIDPSIDRAVHYRMYMWDQLEQEGELVANGSVGYAYTISWMIYANDPSVNVNVMLTTDDWQGANQTQWVTMGLGAKKYMTFTD